MQPLLTQVGAALVDMDRVQVHPTGFVDPKDPWAPVKVLAAEMLRGEGGILVNKHGKRFVNELGTRQNVTEAILHSVSPTKQESGQAAASMHQWDVRIIFDEASANAASSHVGFYQWRGVMRQTRVRDLGASFLDTLLEYSTAAEGLKKDKYGRKSFGKWSLFGPISEITNETIVFVGEVTPVIHFTMGGVAVNRLSQVLDLNKEPLDGLWAAGEVTGGIHGDNRLGSSSLLECVVFGRIAAKELASFYNSLG